MTDFSFHIHPVDRDLKADIQAKIDSKTKPLGALGMLENLALKIGLIQQSLTPKLEQPVMAVFAGDHGIAKEGVVNAYPQEVTWQMVYNFLQGGAAINVFCSTHGLSTKVVDAGVAFDFPEHPNLISRKIRKGTRNYSLEPAMTGGECRRAIQYGAELVELWNKEGTNITGFGEMGIGNTSSASIITSLVTGRPVEECTGRGTGLNDDGVGKKADILKAAVQKHKIGEDSFSILQTFGGYEIAMLTGGILKAAEQKMVIVIDGFIVTAALLITHQLYPAVLDYVVCAHESGEQGHRIQLEYLGEKPLLQLGMRLGEGTGAAVAYPIIESAVAFLNDMASFEGAGVSQGGRA